MRKIQNSNLPHDLVLQILLRLPVKSIFRFKCVCKLWYDLFHNPNFISDHFNFHKNPQINDQSILVSRQNELNLQNELAYEHLVSIITDLQVSHSIDLPQFIKDKDNGEFILHLLGSINGVLCIYLGHDIGLWNPSIREFNVLAQTSAQNGVLNNHVVGFGLKNNDFNVLRMMLYEVSEDDDSYETFWVVELYSVMKGCWREIEVGLSSDLVDVIASNTYLNGSSHWCATLFDDRNMILLFDFTDEVFRTMDLPGDLDDVDELEQLVVVNGCIGLICEVEEVRMKLHLDIWVMMEYGDKESWTKLYRVEPHLRVDSPLGFLRNGEFLFQRDGFLYSYNLETHQKKNLPVYGVLDTMEFVSYTESLISPKGGNWVERTSLIIFEL